MRIEEVSRRKKTRAPSPKYSEEEAKEIYPNAKEVTIPSSSKGVITGYGDSGPYKEQTKIIGSILPRRPKTMADTISEINTYVMERVEEKPVWKNCSWILTPVKATSGQKPGMHVIVYGEIPTGDTIDYFFYSPLNSEGHARKYRVNEGEWKPISQIRFSLPLRRKGLPSVATNLEEVKEWLDIFKIDDAEINDKLEVSRNKGVRIIHQLKQFPFQWNVINGPFEAEGIGLTTLKGFPKVINGGYFRIGKNKYPREDLKYLLFSDIKNGSLRSLMQGLGNKKYATLLDGWFDLTEKEKQGNIVAKMQEIKGMK